MVDVDGEKRAAYSTSDYLEPHPTKPGYWKIIDRVDNQIIHSTGEKVCVLCLFLRFSFTG